MKPIRPLSVLIGIALVVGGLIVTSAVQTSSGRAVLAIPQDMPTVVRVEGIPAPEEMVRIPFTPGEFTPGTYTVPSGKMFVLEEWSIWEGGCKYGGENLNAQLLINSLPIADGVSVLAGQNKTQAFERLALPPGTTIEAIVIGGNPCTPHGSEITIVSWLIGYMVDE